MLDEPTPSGEGGAGTALSVGRFVQPYACYDAVQFDGSRKSALALARAFPGRVALDVKRRHLLLVSATTLSSDADGELRAMTAGSWLVRDHCSRGAPQLLSDQSFRCIFRPASGTDP